MSRITMERNGLMQNGSSRIPRFDHGRSMASSNAFNNMQPLPGVGASQKPSRLEQMQVEYQKNMLKEKEDKLISMFEDNQKRALYKVNQKRGVVREFFNEARAGSGGSKNSTTPTIEQLYHQKRTESQFGQQNGHMGKGGPTMNRSGLNRENMRDKRPSAGRDRANPLAPIQHNNTDDENPFNKRKPQIVRPRTYKGVQSNKNYQEDVTVPKSAPTGFHVDGLSDYTSDDSPLPSSKQLHHLQQKRKMLQDQRQSNKMHTVHQNGQSNTRKTPQSKRNSHYEYETSEEDEGYDEAKENGNIESEMKRKQKELLAQIEAQQRELDRLRNDRMNAELEEKKELERRRKMEEERQKRKIEEERRRQKEEEEERIKQQWEEEKQKKIEMEKRRMRNMSNSNEHSNTDYYNGHYEEQDSPSPPPHHQYYEQKAPSPTPPPQPRPANTRKVVPKKQPQKPRSPSPLPQGNHVEMYANADQIEGAYENVGRLKACFNCGRKFAEDRLGKHEQSCKNITKKRKVMDPSKLRTKGTEMEQYRGHTQSTPAKAKKNNWRAKHESFMQAIQYAKKASQIEKEGGNLADLPPPPPSENPDYVQCPHCSRKFNESAAERHIPHCKNTKARPKPPPQRRR